MELNEHWRLKKDGELAGVVFVDAKQAKGIDLWAKLDEVIKAYTQIHPEEMRIQLAENEFLRLTRKNEYASTGTKDSANLRWGLRMPVGLLFKLQSVEPLLFEDKHLYNKFLKKYKGLTICSKV